MSCFSCTRNAQPDALPLRERIAGDAHWRVAHAFDTGLPGWLILVPRRHVTALAELTDVEAAALGSWQVRLSRALHEATGCVKTYVAQLSEAEGFEHVHFHIVPRAADHPADLIGPRVFGVLRPPPERQIPVAQVDELSARLASLLGGGERFVQ
ncbi:HIT family protein [Dactylosporangium sp. CS-033363]|uniref:HIT family protein n=1 Tax=Dactylosporangium sp. CS-033363 TaxID=3239935 RepID=UPI003D8BFEBD